MASIMTNASAMTALQTLRRVTSDLDTTQDRISTGLKVNNPKDNAAYWSIATTMKADVAGFKAVKESLELGTGTTNTASVAAKNITTRLEDLKARVIAGQTNGVDKSLIQNDIDQLVKLIKGAAADASFNGDNLLRVTYSNDGTAKDRDVSILASLSRSDDTVDPSYITFQRQDLQVNSIIGKATIEQQVDSTNAQKASVAFDIGNAGETFIDGQNLGLGTLSFTFTAEERKGVDVDGAGAGTATVDVPATAIKIEVDLSGIAYDTDKATTEAAIALAINNAVATQGHAQLSAAYTKAGVTAVTDPANLGTAPTDYASSSAAFKDLVTSSAFADVDGKRQLQFTVGTGADGGNFGSQISNLWVGSRESDAFGGLADLTQIDVVNNAKQSLSVINSLLDKAIGKASAIGSIENRVSVQNDFVMKLTDSMNKGIGALVDADMNEESSRLQALQVQQQLAIQALSIANQGPQNILSLFR